jgi:Zn-dependent peptidase ImmA (M78 family)
MTNYSSILTNSYEYTCFLIAKIIYKFIGRWIMYTIQPADKSANKLLEIVWKDRDFPVDPVWIAGELGLGVLETDLPDEVNAAIIKDKGKDAIIALSSSDSKNRKRFSCAHEIGHYIYHMSRNDDQYQYIDLRSKESSNGSEPEEIFANQFAANLLMPENKVKELYKNNLPTFLIAQYFGVSDEAMNYRLKNIGLQ